MHGLYLNTICMICTVCEQPALVCHVMVRGCHTYVNLSCLCSSGFTSTLHSGSSPSPTRQWAGPIACTKLPVDVQSSWNIYMHSFKIYGIWPQTDRHTQNFCKFSHPSVGLTHARPNNVILVYADAAEGQMSALRETQPTPTSLQGESQMSKCDIVRLVGINNWG